MHHLRRAAQCFAAAVAAHCHAGRLGYGQWRGEHKGRAVKMNQTWEFHGGDSNQSCLFFLMNITEDISSIWKNMKIIQVFV